MINARLAFAGCSWYNQDIHRERTFAMLAFYLSLADSEEERSLIEFLYNKYRYVMYKTAFDILHNESDSEDIVHEAFLRIIKNISKFKSYSCRENTTYIVMIVKGLSLNVLKKRKKYTDIYEDIPAAVSLEQSVELKIEYEEVLKIIRQLSPSLQPAATLYFSRGFSVQEISDVLEMNIGTVYSCISRARKAIIDTYEKQEKKE